MRALRWLVLAWAFASSTGCLSLRYYSHVARGHLGVLGDRERISHLVDDPATDPRLRERLRGALAAREFASARLGLPRNRSYTTYVALDRPYATWNVFAAPEFSVEPVPSVHLPPTWMPMTRPSETPEPAPQFQRMS